MYEKIVNTGNHFSGLVCRVALALVLFTHGSQKLLGWFGGRGFAPSLAFLANVLLVPRPLGVFLMVFEVFGAIFLLLGLFGRIAGLGAAIMMIVAGLDTFRLYGHFFMNWAGTYKGEGIEYHMLALAVSVALVIHGSGALSIDRVLSRDEVGIESSAFRHAAAGSD